MQWIKQHISDVPDFPKEGVLFRDISPLLSTHFNATIEALASLFEPNEWDDISHIVGIDARGFLFASGLSVYLKKHLALVRKGGKLPPPVERESYSLEYGEDMLEMKPGNGKVIIMDDVLATGGTLQAAANLCVKAGYDVKGLATLIDLTFLNNFEWDGLKARSLVQYHE